MARFSWPMDDQGLWSESEIRNLQCLKIMYVVVGGNPQHRNKEPEFSDSWRE